MVDPVEVAALTVGRTRSSGLRLGTVPRPLPGPGQLVVEVSAISLVDRDLRYAPEILGDGGVWGFDAAGVVAQAAADGTGPAVGTPVVTLRPSPGAWSRFVTADTVDVAELPAGLDAGTATAAALPGVSALQALRAFGPLAGQRMLVTAASAGVGWYAVQLAARAGAEVVAVVRNRADADGLVLAGAASVVTDVTAVAGQVHGVFDVVGGPTLAHAVDLLADGGVAVLVGAVSGEPTEFGDSALVNPRRPRLQGYWGQWPVGADLREVVGLLGDGLLRPTTSWRGSWTAVGELAAGFASGRLRRRRAVLDVH